MIPDTSWRISAWLLPFFALSLTAARPPSQGAEVSVAGGWGFYEAQKVWPPSAPVERGEEWITDLRFRHGFRKGWSLHVQQTFAPVRLASNDGARYDFNSWTLVRVGLHKEYFGIELGPGLTMGTPWFHRPQLLISGWAWAGDPALVYGYLGVVPDLATGGTLGLVEAGVGHTTDRFRAELGANWEALTGRVDVPIGGDVWVGVDLGYQVGALFTGDRPDRRALVRLTFGPGVWREGPRE